jgi:hypothetical protein
MDRQTDVSVSARTGTGANELRRAIVRELTGEDSLRDPAAISNVRHITLLEQARARLVSAQELVEAGDAPEEFVLADLQAALLEEIIGLEPARNCSIFAKFCVEMIGFDVIVIGAGMRVWKPCAARLGCTVGLCTLSKETVAHMPCNPAVGGTAKGHLVREIDALGGLMGRAIDATGIQFKLLNRSRGPAVWSPRAQADKRRYSEWVADAIEGVPNISWVIGKAARPDVERRRIVGLVMDDGTRYACRGLVVTTGTFLNGLIHVGSEQRPAGATTAHSRIC